MSTRKFVWITVAALMLVVVSVLLLWGIRSYRRTIWTRVTPAQVDADIRQKVPIGSTRENVIAFLDARNIAHTYYGSESDKNYKFYRCEVALVRDTASHWVITSSIQIVFRFDNDMRLASFELQEINTGP
jgi:hypothetical protein